MKIYAIVQTCDIEGLQDVICYYNHKQDAETVLHYIEAVRFDVNNLHNTQNFYYHENRDSWTPDKEATRSKEWKAIDEWGRNAVRAIHYKFEIYYDYEIIELELGKTVGSIQ